MKKNGKDPLKRIHVDARMTSQIPKLKSKSYCIVSIPQIFYFKDILNYKMFSISSGLNNFFKNVFKACQEYLYIELIADQ